MTHCRFLSWNPDGFKRIWNNDHILELLKTFDFVSIYETWCDSKEDCTLLESKLDGFICFNEQATRLHKYGRSSGGIAVYVKEKYQNVIEKLDMGFKFAVILEIKGV